MTKRIPGLGSALILAVGLSGLLVLAAILSPSRPSPLIFPVDHGAAGFSPASRPQSYRPMGTSITPITSVAAGSSGILLSGDAYDVSCTVSAATGTLYPAMHDGSAWTVYYAYPCALDGTVVTKATCIFPARRDTGLTWNAFKVGAATINACAAVERSGGGMSAVPPPPAAVLTASSMPSAIDATKIADGSVTNTEFQYIGTLTSNAQTQIDGKAATSHAHAGADITSGDIAAARIANALGASGGALTITAGDTSTWSTSSGNLTVSAAGNMTVSTPNGSVYLDGFTGLQLQAAGMTIADIGATTAATMTFGSGKSLAIQEMSIAAAPAIAAANKIQVGVADINGDGTTARKEIYEGAGSLTEWVETAGAMKVMHIAREIADDGTLTLPIPANVGVLDIWNYNGHYARGVVIGPSGDVQVFGTMYSASFITSDTDAKLCVYDGGTAAILKNRLGAAQTFVGTYRWN